MANRAWIKITTLVACAISAFAALPASAGIYRFTFDNLNGLSGSFDIDDVETPTNIVGFDTSFRVTALNGVRGGTSYDFNDMGGVFFTNPSGNGGQNLGFRGTDGQAYFYYGDKLFSGPGVDPQFLPGTYVQTGISPTQSSMLTVSLAPGVPAPLIGYGLFPLLATAGGLVATRRRRLAATTSA